MDGAVVLPAPPSIWTPDYEAVGERLRLPRWARPWERAKEDVATAAITVNGTPVTAAATTIALPTHAAGDIIVIWAYRSSSTAPPTIPAAGGTVPTWVTIDAPTGGNTNSADCCYAVATATNHTSGTWTNATELLAIVLRGVDNTTPIGGHAQTTAAAALNMAAPAVTMTKTDGTSFLLVFYGYAATSSVDAAPAGYTRQVAGAGASAGVVCNSKNSTTSDGAITQTRALGSAAVYAAQQVEFLQAPSARPFQRIVGQAVARAASR